MSTVQRDIGHYFDTARELADQIASQTDRIDSERQLPPEITDAMAAEGFFRLLVPRSLGGAELDHPDFLKIVEIFAEVDASTAWCINQNNVFATNSTRMPKQTAKELYSDPRLVITNGPPTSASKAVPVDGGYRLSGRWNFSSGIPHATWVAALTPVRHPGDSQRPLSDRSTSRIFLVPKNEVRLIDTWDVVGLRGTGSFSFEIDDLFVPETYTYDPASKPREDGPLYCVPTMLFFAAGFATVALGAARAALHAAIELAQTKVEMLEDHTLRDLSTTQRTVGEAEAIWGAAKAYLRETASAMWEDACNHRSLSDEERIRLRLAGTHGIRSAGEVVDIAYTLCGSGSIFANSPVQRRFRDVHTI
ncbi:MAG: acyl-CoA dehydrogenase family protein, partial [Candidatus Tectomicrobia bacterium]|nr:acyl-CoA dehydrogenase family protein [Candidatus Tectomicrobia bacterium]